MKSPKLSPSNAGQTTNWPGQLTHTPKSVLLLGPRLVGKSTLCASLSPDLTINLALQRVYFEHQKDPGLLERIVNSHQQPILILIDEIQRLPGLLNTVQALIDTTNHRFLLTGSSARKLKRGQANLLPGRIFLERLTPLPFHEIGEDDFDLARAITLGTLPEVYLNDYGSELLESYVSTYLREEIQAEALTKNLGAYSRFLDLVAELSGHYINYSKVSSDSEINKETLRRYVATSMFCMTHS